MLQAVTYKVPQHNDVLNSINIVHADSVRLVSIESLCNIPDIQDTMVTMLDGKSGKECLIRSAPDGFKAKANALGAFEARLVCA